MRDLFILYDGYIGTGASKIKILVYWKPTNLKKENLMHQNYITEQPGYLEMTDGAFFLYYMVMWENNGMLIKKQILVSIKVIVVVTAKMAFGTQKYSVSTE